MIFFLSQRDAVEMAALTLIQGQFPQIQKEEMGQLEGALWDKRRRSRLRGM